MDTAYNRVKKLMRGKLLVWAKEVSAGVMTKSALSEQGSSDAANAPMNPQLDNNHWLHLRESSSITPPGGRTGEITANGESYLQVRFFQRNRATFTKNSSRVAWLGDSPFNADKVIHTDNWRVDAFPGAITISNAPDGSISEQPGDLQWQTEVENSWISQHSWDEVTFTTSAVLYRSRFNVTGAFQFGSSFFVVTARDSAST